jgi:hypothetical protein
MSRPFSFSWRSWRHKMDNRPKREQWRNQLAAVRLAFGVAGGLLSGVIAYSCYLLLAAWIDNSGDLVVRGHGIDFVALFGVSFCEWIALYCGVPIAAMIGSLIGAFYLAPRFCRNPSDATQS